MAEPGIQSTTEREEENGLECTLLARVPVASSSAWLWACLEIVVFAR
jgi:hypothetical protein